MNAFFKFFEASWDDSRTIESGHFFKEHVNGQPVGECSRESKEADVENGAAKGFAETESKENQEDGREVRDQAFVQEGFPF